MLTTRADVSRYVAELTCASDLTQQQREAVVSAFVSAVEPEYTYTSELIAFHSRGGGSSRKPGHIMLSWRRMFDLVPDTAVAGAGAVGEGRYVHVLVALYIWNKVWRGMEVELTHAEASVIEALWCGTSSSRLKAAEARSLVNQARVAAELPELSPGEFRSAVDRLVELHCIKR